MRKKLHHEPRCIILPASVLDVLKDMPASSLKVLIYLCSCNQGQPLAVSRPTIAGATGITARSVISAVDFLCERKLITRISGSGNQPNQYGIPLPARQQAAPLLTNETTASPNLELRQATPPVATPAKVPIRALITACYRQLDDQEFAQLQKAHPDESVLRAKLERCGPGGVAAYLALSFFVAAIDKPSPR